MDKYEWALVSGVISLFSTWGRDADEFNWIASSCYGKFSTYIYSVDELVLYSLPSHPRYKCFHVPKFSGHVWWLVSDEYILQYIVIFWYIISIIRSLASWFETSHLYFVLFTFVVEVYITIKICNVANFNWFIDAMHGLYGFSLLVCFSRLIVLAQKVIKNNTK